MYIHSIFIIYVLEKEGGARAAIKKDGPLTRFHLTERFSALFHVPRILKAWAADTADQLYTYCLILVYISSECSEHLQLFIMYPSLHTYSYIDL